MCWPFGSERLSVLMPDLGLYVVPDKTAYQEACCEIEQRQPGAFPESLPCWAERFQNAGNQ